ncbi:MAG TPA: hypothetical protein VGM18_03525 [Candidatus Sulfotelmatobacter sp.]|jgi:hypothetical protein
MPEYTLSSILPFVRSGLRRVRTSFTLTAFINATWTELEKSGAQVRRSRPPATNNPDNPEFAHNNDSQSLRQSAVQAWLYLQRRDFAIPASRNFPSLDSMHVELTTRGREWVDGHEPIPELPAEYIAALQRMVPNLDDVVREYMVEGLGTLEHDRFRAAAVMVGAASEKALYMLAEKMLDAISTPQWKAKFATALKRRDLTGLFEQMRNVLEKANNLQGRPFEIFDGGQDHLVSLIKAVQVQRNNAVHPMNEKVSDDTIRLSYLAFPYVLQKVEQLRDWFSNNPNVL